MRIFLFAILLIAAAAFPVTPAAAQVVALGASNTQGHGVGAVAAFPAQLEALLKAKGLEVKVANAGISGDTTRGMLARLAKAVPDGTKVVVVQFGGNDQRQGITPDQRKANIAQIRKILEDRNIKLVQADMFVAEALKAGLKQADNIHLTIPGHKQVAEKLFSGVQAGLK